MNPILLYALAIAAGILAGFINTLAGSGSLVTLPMLMALGLPAPVANGTNRVGVLFQNVVGIWKFKQSGQLDLDRGGFLILPSVLGAIVGANIAIDLNEQAMRQAIAVVMAIMLVVIILRPQQWLRKHSDQDNRIASVGNFVIFFAVGVYGGFIQAGVGVFLLAALVLGCRFSMVHANALKLCIVLILTIPALAIFAWNHQVHLGFGLLMAVGQSIGAWLAAHYASNSENATVWMRRLLIAIVSLSILKLAGLF